MIRQAPLIHAVALCITTLITGTVLFFALHAYFSNVIDTQEQRLSLANERLSAYENKFPGKTPDEIASKMAALEAEVARLEPKVARIEPRHITNKQKQIMAEVFTKLGKSKIGIQILRDIHCSDCGNYSSELISFLEQFRYFEIKSVAAVIGGSIDGSPKGMLIMVPNVPKTLAVADVLFEAFNSAGIPFDAGKDYREDTNPELIFFRITTAIRD